MNSHLAGFIVGAVYTTTRPTIPRAPIRLARSYRESVSTAFLISRQIVTHASSRSAFITASGNTASGFRGARLGHASAGGEPRQRT